MNTRVRTRLQSVRTPLKHEKITNQFIASLPEKMASVSMKRSRKFPEILIKFCLFDVNPKWVFFICIKFKFPLVLKETIKIQGSKPNDATKTAAKNQQASNRQRKIALQQDVDKLKKKLRHEENIHRALERSFNRPLGALPRLPSYLPPATLELLAEVAVLEEEVVRLEEQVVHFRQDLYQEAVYISSSKRNLESFADIYHLHPNKNARAEQHKSLPTKLDEAARSKRHLPPLSEDGPGKQNQLCTSLKSNEGLSVNKTQTGRNPLKRPIDTTTSEKCSDPQKLQLESRITSQVQARSLCNSDEKPPGGDSPNKISEDTVKCLSSIFSRISSVKNRHTADCLPFLSTLMSEENGQECELQDPYHICSEFGKRDIGPYKQLFSVKAGAINPNRTSNCLFLLHRLKLLLGKLAAIDLQKLTHQEKLAFWINIYNSCMMNAFLENGMPESPEMIVVLMQKATINVGGHLLNPITIEHFILRLPYHSKYNLPRGAKNEDVTARSKFGLELSEPLVTFALSCGSWSSPAVRVYTASQVENELEAAKREYLQAAIGISGTKFGIPKLLDWYLLDFAKDLESLLDWICLQLPTELGKEAIMYLERGKSQPHSQFVQIMPYEFSFRYLLYT